MWPLGGRRKLLWVPSWLMLAMHWKGWHHTLKVLAHILTHSPVVNHPGDDTHTAGVKRQGGQEGEGANFNVYFHLYCQQFAEVWRKRKNIVYLNLWLIFPPLVCTLQTIVHEVGGGGYWKWRMQQLHRIRHYKSKKKNLWHILLHLLYDNVIIANHQWYIRRSFKMRSPVISFIRGDPSNVIIHDREIFQGNFCHCEQNETVKTSMNGGIPDSYRKTKQKE